MDIRGLGNPLVIIDGIPRDNMARVDPEDVESISVLKDASASIYGVACCQWRDSYYHQKKVRKGNRKLIIRVALLGKCLPISQIWLLHKNG